MSIEIYEKRPITVKDEYYGTCQMYPVMMRKDGRMYCLEANTLPGMTPTSLLPQEAQVLGISYPELCELLIQLSLRKRGNNA